MNNAVRSWPLLLVAAALLITGGVRIWQTTPGDALAGALIVLGSVVLGAWLAAELRGPSA